MSSPPPPIRSSGRPGVRLVVSVDNELCQGHARCWDLLPDVFTLDDEGYSDIGSRRAVPPGLEDQARRAVKSCPERALTVEELGDEG